MSIFHNTHIHTSLLNSIVAVCTDLSGKEPHRQVGVGRVVTPGSLGSIIVCTLAKDAGNVGLIPALGAIFPIFITPTTLLTFDHDPVQPIHCTVVESTRCICVRSLLVCHCKQ